MGCEEEKKKAKKRANLLYTRRGSMFRGESGKQ